MGQEINLVGCDQPFWKIYFEIVLDLKRFEDGKESVSVYILSSFFDGEGNGNPLQYSCLENSVDRGAWWAAVYRAAQSRTPLKRLSNSSSFFEW